MTLTRRGVIRLAGGAAIVAPLATACGNGGGAGGDNSNEGSTGRLLESAAPLPEPFGVALPIPPVLEPVSTDGGTDHYEITQRAAEIEILPGLRTEVWGYNGIFPGPTIVSRSNRPVAVTHRNELPVPVVVHLHGGKTPPEHDGYPTDMILPAGGPAPSGHESHGGQSVPLGDTSDGTRVYEFPLEQPAATLWYHDHRMDFTGPQVYRGLAGFHIVHDDVEDALPLPTGDRDVPLMICDRAFEEDGAFAYPSLDPGLQGEPGVENPYMSGVLGDVILVNGAPWPHMEVTGTRYRFRILNASNARRYKLALDPPPAEGAAFTQIGSDAGLLGAPVELDDIEAAPAERFDVVVDFSAYPIDSEVTLVNAFGEDGTAQVMRFRVVEEADDDTEIPDRLADFETLARADAVATRRVRFAREAANPGGGGNLWTINGETFDPDRVDFEPALGSTEVWRITTNVHHPVHLHLAHFQVLSRDGGDPGPYDAGWKDTIDLRDGEEAEILVRFTGYPGRYVYHCHNLEHEDMMMMANFTVV
ncbi:multicopper oxidase family protein [Nocardiopsis sediminis]|uniref:Multicopper oxidase family protein n=1 Tax=Nocardiopsis sediminis TaxID=1778267 RepID=A0ABV8FPB5_9ACTN